MKLSGSRQLLTRSLTESLGLSRLQLSRMELRLLIRN